MDRQLLRLGDGEIEYVDTGGDHPTLVLLHGALMDERLWLPVVQELSGRARCVIPVLPMGAHRIPRPDRGSEPTWPRAARRRPRSGAAPA